MNLSGRILSDLEMYVLAAIERLGEDAYGASIHAEIESRSGRETAFGSVYVTLERLARKAEEARQIQSARREQKPKKRKKQPRF